MGSKVEYVESSHMYATNYVRNSKAIGVLWGVFSICYAIIVAVAFATPEWLGDPAAVASDHSARFGLFARCYYRTGAEGGPDCQGGLDELTSLPTVAWQLAAVLVALAALFALLAVAAMLLFFFLPATAVFRSAAWIQLLSGARGPWPAATTGPEPATQPGAVDTAGAAASARAVRLAEYCDTGNWRGKASTQQEIASHSALRSLCDVFKRGGCGIRERTLKQRALRRERAARQATWRGTAP